jgi:2-amino-4-hydroxy-6-hydroxymethyldihydropteridine diphosphokinase
VSDTHPSPHQAYVAFGSNLGTAAGDPAATILAGMRALARALGDAGLRASSLYETAPVGYLDQPAFVNAVAAVQTSLSPETLLHTLLAVEQAFGRERAAPNGPRTLDLDLLMVDDLVLSTATLVLPHPRLAQRRFVLTPLAEIAPGLLHPLLRRTMAQLLMDLPDAGETAISGVRRLAAAVAL